MRFFESEKSFEILNVWKIQKNWVSNQRCERIELSSVTIEFKLWVPRLSSSLSSRFWRSMSLSLSSSFSGRNSFWTQTDSTVNSETFHRFFTKTKLINHWFDKVWCLLLMSSNRDGQFCPKMFVLVPENCDFWVWVSGLLVFRTWVRVWVPHFTEFRVWVWVPYNFESNSRLEFEFLIFFKLYAFTPLHPMQPENLKNGLFTNPWLKIINFLQRTPADLQQDLQEAAPGNLQKISSANSNRSPAVSPADLQHQLQRP